MKLLCERPLSLSALLLSGSLALSQTPSLSPGEHVGEGPGAAVQGCRLASLASRWKALRGLTCAAPDAVPKASSHPFLLPGGTQTKIILSFCSHENQVPERG